MFGYNFALFFNLPRNDIQSLVRDGNNGMRAADIVIVYHLIIATQQHKLIRCVHFIYDLHM